MRNMPYYAQPEGVRSCGAACLCMVYEYFGIECNQNEIFKDVSRVMGGKQSCRCSLMVQNAWTQNLAAYCVSCKTLHGAIPAFLAAQFKVIALSHRTDGTNDGHFYLVTDVSGNGRYVYVNDPWPGYKGGKNVRLQLDTFATRSKCKGSDDEVEKDNTLILIRNSTSTDDLVNFTPDEGQRYDIPCSILEHANLILNTHMNKWDEIIKE